MNIVPGKTPSLLMSFRCDNHYVIKAVTAQDKGKLVIEFEAEKGFEHKLFKDEREKERQRMFQAEDADFE